MPAEGGQAPARREPRARGAREAGFVITLEFLLVMVLFVLPLLLGGILLGRKLITAYLDQREYDTQPYSQAMVFDSASPARAVGRVVGYDPWEAPYVIFRDSATKAGVLLGVRTDRFTTAGPVFYDGADCTGRVLLRSHADPYPTTGGSYLSSGFLYQLQGRSYAVGKGNVLYTADPLATPVDVTVGSTTGFTQVYAWRSQNLQRPATGGSVTLPCEEVGAGSLLEALVDATEVIDLDAAGNYVPPFRVAFASPSDTPFPAITPGESTP